MKEFLLNTKLIRLAVSLVGVFLLLLVISDDALSDPPDTLDLQLQWACSLTIIDFKLVDFDSDGISEILIGFYSDSARVGILDAASETTVWRSPALDGSIVTVAAGDRNNDGFLDIVGGGQRSDTSIGYIEIFDGPDFDSVYSSSGFDRVVLSAAVSASRPDSLPRIFVGTACDTAYEGEDEDEWVYENGGKLYVLNGPNLAVEDISSDGQVKEILLHGADGDACQDLFLGMQVTKHHGSAQFGDYWEWTSWVKEITSSYCHNFGLLSGGHYSPHWTGCFGSLVVGTFNGGPSTFIIGSSYIDWWHAGYQDSRLACWNESTAELEWSLSWSSWWGEHKWINDLAICSLDAGQTNAVCAVYHSGLTEFRDISDGSLLAVSQLPYRTFQIEFGNVDNDSLIEICVRFEESNRFHIYEMPSMPTGVEEIEDHSLPDDFRLFQNYPNPFNPETNIRFTIPVASEVTLGIYNILGEQIRTFEKHLKAGTHTLIWDGKNSSGKEVASGVYLYKLSAGTYEETKKMVLIR